MVHVIQKEENKEFAEVSHAKARIEQDFQRIIDKYKKLYSEVGISYIIKEGRVYREVINQAEAYKDSIIVTSTHGASGWEELIIGGNAYKIVSSSSRPIFSMRGDNVPKQIRRIVLPLDTTLETREKVPFTTQLAAKLNAKVLVITVSTTELPDIQAKLDNYLTQVCRYLSHHNIENSSDRITGNNITDMIIEYALDKKADLISIMTEQEKSVSNILLGSYAHQMINKAPVPVLLFPTRQIGIITESFITEGIKY